MPGTGRVGFGGCAGAYGFNANLVRKWIAKHQRRQGLSHGSGALAPVSVIKSPASSLQAPRARTDARALEPGDGWIEIEVGAARVIVRGQVETAQLRVVLDALDLRR